MRFAIRFRSFDKYIEDQGPELPTRSNQEFRPFIRRLPEFKFWYEITRSIVIGLACTFFEIFNIPVFWPILVMYFITLFCITMKRQIKVSAIWLHSVSAPIIMMFCRMFYCST